MQFPGIHPGEIKMYSHVKTCMWRFVVASFTIPQNWKWHEYCSTGEGIDKLRDVYQIDCYPRIETNHWYMQQHDETLKHYAKNGRARTSMNPPTPKATKILAKQKNATTLELWKLTTDREQTAKHLFKKNSWTSVTTVSLWHFKLGAVLTCPGSSAQWLHSV